MVIVCSLRPRRAGLGEPALPQSSLSRARAASAARTACTKARTRAASFTPGACSTPEATSTPQGATSVTASADVLGPEPAGQHQRSRRRDLARRVPVDGASRAADRAPGRAHRRGWPPGRSSTGWSRTASIDIALRTGRGNRAQSRDHFVAVQLHAARARPHRPRSGLDPVSRSRTRRRWTRAAAVRA